jgi:nucleoid DNA-binding protein
VNKADIVTQIASGTGLTRVETEAVVEGFLASVIEAMREGEHIEIRGFGTFKVKHRAPRIARNPRSGESVAVPSLYTPTFKASRELRSLVNENLQKKSKESQ